MKKTKSIKPTKQQVKTAAIDLLYIIAGNIICAAALNIFILPNEIALAGVSGIAVIVNHLFPFIPFGAANLGLNFPLIILAFVILGWRFVSKTVIAVIGFSVISDLFATFVTYTYTDDRLLATLLGGAVMGAGSALVLARGATGGGTEVIGWLVRRRWPHISLGKVIFAISSAVIVAGAFAFGDIGSALYAAIMTYIITRVIDGVLYGINNGKVLYIFSNKSKVIAAAVIAELGRSASILPAKGAYSGDQQEMLMCVVRRNEMSILRRIVKEHDPKSFMVIAEAQEVYGMGWKRE